MLSDEAPSFSEPQNYESKKEERKYMESFYILCLL